MAFRSRLAVTLPFTPWSRRISIISRTVNAILPEMRERVILRNPKVVRVIVEESGSGLAEKQRRFKVELCPEMQALRY